jgi:hypothetical protein
MGALHRLRGMEVRVRRYADRRVPEGSGDRFQIRTGRQGNGRVRMTKVVQADLWQFLLAHELRKRPAERIRVPRLSVRPVEDECIRVFHEPEELAPVAPFLLLTLERLNNERR